MKAAALPVLMSLALTVISVKGDAALASLIVAFISVYPSVKEITADLCNTTHGG